MNKFINNKEKKKIGVDLMRTEKKLQNNDFIGRAPKEVIEKEKAKREDLTSKLLKIDESLKQLEAL